jgi:2-C-methyl-D-erythritol 4-phosphate cytidylyltransferase
MPMVACAVQCLLDSGLVHHVLVLDAQARVGAIERACTGLPVSVRGSIALLPLRPHVDQRRRPPAGDGQFATGFADVVLVHDAARPLAPSGLAVAVVDAVRSGHAAAVPVLKLADTVKQVDGGGRVRSSPDRSTLRIVQTPQAVRRDLIDRASALEPLSAALVHAATGASVHTVPGDPLAFAVRTAWDRELAELAVRRAGAP